MRLITNSIDTNDVEETEDAWLIHDVPIVRPMRLSGGYVPESNIKETARQWSNVPATLNHPRNQKGEPIAANRKPETHIGISENANFNGEFVTVDLEIKKDRLESLGGEAKDIEQALENGETIDVSSQYAAEDAPPGEYDGKHRANVERIIRPDSIAILPNKQGKCSVKDGCGINPEMVANSEISIPMESTQADDGSTEDWDTQYTMHANQDINYSISDVYDPDEFDDYTDDEWSGSEVISALPNPSEDDEAPGILDDTMALVPDENRDNKSAWKAPFRASPEGPVNTRAVVAIKAAAEGARGGFDNVSQDTLDELVEASNALLRDAPGDLFGSMESNAQHTDMESNTISTVVNALADFVTGNSEDGEPAQSGATDDTMDREKYINEITANSPLTEESLSERCDDGLEAIHSDVMAANDDGGDGGDDDDTMTDNNEIEELREEISEVKEMLTANERQQKEEIAQEIVANSAEYEDTESVLEDYPTEAALSTKKDSVTEDGGVMPGMGATANAEFETEDDLEDVPSGVMN